MKEFQAQMGDAFKPAALLEKLVAEGKTFPDDEITAVRSAVTAGVSS